MTNSDGQEGIVGKSVEEIEAEEGNRVNSPVEGEHRHDDTIPAIPLGVAGTGITGANSAGGGLGLAGVLAVAGSDLTDHSGEAEDGQHSSQRDSSEE